MSIGQPSISASASTSSWASWWPLVMAPFVGLLYYLALIAAFRTAIVDVVRNTEDLPLTGLTWGAHWLYHLFAEIASVSFGVFVAAGLGRERGGLVGLISGFGVTLWWTAWISILAFLLIAGGWESAGEPVYEYVIAAFTGVAAPIIGYRIGIATVEFSTRSTGFSGIPRAHFLWFWFPVYWYAAAMIGPFMNFYLRADESLIGSLFYLFVYMIPFLAFLIPLYFGLSFLSVEFYTQPRRRQQIAFHQVAGAAVLICGWFVAAGIQYAIIKLQNWMVG